MFVHVKEGLSVHVGPGLSKAREWGRESNATWQMRPWRKRVDDEPLEIICCLGDVTRSSTLGHPRGPSAQMLDWCVYIYKLGDWKMDYDGSNDRAVT